MPIVSSLCVALQDPVHASGTQIDLLTIFVGIIALFFLLLMIGMAIGAWQAVKAIKKVEAKIDSLEKRGEAILADATAKAQPFIDKAHAIMEDLQPKIKSVTDDVQHISQVVRSKVDEVGATVSQVNGTVQDVNAKTRNQAQRVDGIVTNALTATHDISNKIQAGIRYPINQVAGWVAGLKTGLETLAQRSPLGKRKPTSPYDL